MIDDEGIHFTSGEIFNNRISSIFELFKELLEELKEEYSNLLEELIEGATNKIAVLNALDKFKSRVEGKGNEILAQNENSEPFSAVFDTYCMAIGQYISSGQSSRDDEFIKPTKKEEILYVFSLFEANIGGVENMVKEQLRI